MASKRADHGRDHGGEGGDQQELLTEAMIF